MFLYPMKRIFIVNEWNPYIYTCTCRHLSHWLITDIFCITMTEIVIMPDYVYSTVKVGTNDAFNISCIIIIGIIVAWNSISFIIEHIVHMYVCMLDRLHVCTLYMYLLLSIIDAVQEFQYIGNEIWLFYYIQMIIINGN
jgi:hypothetical protein